MQIYFIYQDLTLLHNRLNSFMKMYVTRKRPEKFKWDTVTKLTGFQIIHPVLLLLGAKSRDKVKIWITIFLNSPRYNPGSGKYIYIYSCCCWITQLFPTLCNLMAYSPPGSAVRGISQARTLHWIVISNILHTHTHTHTHVYISYIYIWHKNLSKTFF